MTKQSTRTAFHSHKALFSILALRRTCLVSYFSFYLNKLFFKRARLQSKSFLNFHFSPFLSSTVSERQFYPVLYLLIVATQTLTLSELFCHRTRSDFQVAADDESPVSTLARRSRDCWWAWPDAGRPIAAAGFVADARRERLSSRGCGDSGRTWLRRKWAFNRSSRLADHATSPVRGTPK